MKRLVTILPILLSIALVGCWMNGTHKSGETVRGTGAVRHYDIEGGFWAIRGDDGTTYDPMNGLPSEFQEEGLRVRFEVKLRPDMAGIHQVGPIVEIISIRRL